MRTKPLLIGSLLISLLLFTNNLSIFGQTCATCPGNTVTGIKASAFGDGNTASGNYSFVAGRSSEASKHNAVVIGSYSKATGLHSYVVGSNSFATGNFAYAFGGNSKAEMDFSMAIGHNIVANLGGFALGVGKVDALLTNNLQESLVIGFNSAYPTLFVSRTPIDQQSGRIGIGNVTSPQAKLHIRADEGEDASLLLEPSDPRRQQAMLQMLDANTGLTAGINTGLQLFTDLGLMQFTAGQFTFEGPVKVAGLEVNGAYSLPLNQGNPGEFLSHNGTWAVPSGGGGGSSYWQPSGSTIFYNGGNVGIGTSDTKGYKLGVNGKIIATEVVVKYFSQWPDYVFEPGYPLMPLPELQEFVQTHQHLPDMPPAQQVAETGVPVGEMNALLLKKVEELTLYVLQQQQAMEQQQKEIELLKQKLQD